MHASMYGCIYIHNYVKLWQIQDIVDVFMQFLSNSKGQILRHIYVILMHCPTLRFRMPEESKCSCGLSVS